MSVAYHRPLGLCAGLLLVLTMAMPAAAQNSGTLTDKDEREISFNITTNPEILTLEVTEMLRTTAKVQIRFIQETECMILPGMVGRLQNIADVLAAGAIAERLKNKLQAEIDATVRTTLFESSVPVRNCDKEKRGDPAHAAKKAEAIKKLISLGFEMLEPVEEKHGTITVTWTPWVRKVGSSGTKLGEVTGIVKLKLVGKIDQKYSFVGGFKTVEAPNFLIEDMAASYRQQAKAQYEEFKKRFTDTYKDLLKRLDKFEKRIFSTPQERRKFKHSTIGSPASRVHRVKSLSIPFMGTREPLTINIGLTAGKWLDEWAHEGVGPAPSPYIEFDDNN